MPTDDLDNRILSLGLDRHWRRQAAKFLPSKNSLFLLDCAPDRGQITIMEHTKKVGQAIGIDLATEMLRGIGREKINKRPIKNKVLLQEGSATALPFSSNTFDCATISFGIRNVKQDVPLALTEMHRVLKPGGRIIVLNPCRIMTS